MMTLHVRSGLLLALVLTGMLVTAGTLLSGTRFNHADHEDEDCLTCHPGAPNSLSGYDNLLPASTDGCVSDCHEPGEMVGVSWGLPASPLPEFAHGEALAEGAECAECHTKTPVLPGHENGVRHTHQFDVRGAASGSCESCHRNSQTCLDCHQGENVDFTTHSQNYLVLHAEDARKDLIACGSCHVRETFCVDCHAAERVFPRDHRAPDWATADGGLHALEARRDIAYCVSCHDTGELPICARCHGE